MVSADDGSPQASFDSGNPSAPLSLDATLVAVLYDAHAAELQRFLLVICRNPAIAADVLQAAFLKLLEQGGGVQSESRKAWLFQVAYRLALAMRRREGVGQRVMASWAWLQSEEIAPPDDAVARQESIARVRHAMDELPSDQRQVVCMRIDEEKTFAEIASELQIPLGTALSRMHAAVQKLRQVLGTVE
ncbi:MAG: RNA polymerase sigma factor [Planctomycetota bacterium]